MPCGVIIGKAKLVGIKEYKNDEEHSADSAWRKHGFILENAQRVKEIPVNGKLNFLEYANTIY